MSSGQASDQFEEVESISALVERWLAETRPPRSARALVDLVDLVAPVGEGTGADVGAYECHWAAMIAERYACRMVALDIAPSPLRVAPRLGVAPVNADAQHLPFPSASLSLVWCRDTLSMVKNLQAALVEIAKSFAAGLEQSSTPRSRPSAS